MKELMDLLTRLVLALEVIARSFAGAAGDVEAGSLRSAPRGGTGGVGLVDDLRKEVTPPPPDRRPSDMRDVFKVSPEVLERSRAAMVQFSIDNMTVPWSEAHMRALMDYEKQVEREFGEGSSEQLPWRRLVPRGEDVGR